MGTLCTRSSSTFTMDKRVLLLGLDQAGKTTLLYHLKLGQVVAVNPTTGFNVESIERNSKRLTVWDLAGEKRLRTLWEKYFECTEGIIFVVDSTDRDRIRSGDDNVLDELQVLLQSIEISGVPLLIFANKSDLPNHIDEDELTQMLKLYKIQDRKWCVFECSATTGAGIEEGVGWLCEQLK